MPESVKLALSTLVTFLVLMAIWYAAIAQFGIPSYVLPTPGQIGQSILSSWSTGAFWYHAWFTTQGAMIGCLIGSIIGIGLGVVVAEVRIARMIFYPLVIAIQSMPTVAVAPLIVVYLGVGLASKIVTVALLCFFPVFVNTVAGIQAADPKLIDLYRAASATRFRLFVDVKLPGAADHIMSGLQVATVLAFVGCVVSEFVASSAGLGYVIKTFASELNVSIMFAAIVTLALIGGGIGLAMSRLHQKLVFWHPQR